MHCLTSTALDWHYVSPIFVFAPGEYCSRTPWKCPTSVTSSTPNFTTSALRKICGRESAPLELVTDNESSLTTEMVGKCMKSVCRHIVLTPPRNRSSKGTAENIFENTKSPSRSSAPPQLDVPVENFLV